MFSVVPRYQALLGCCASQPLDIVDGSRRKEKVVPDTEGPAVRSRKQEVLEAFQERHEQGESPFGNAREFLSFMQDHGSDLDSLGVGVAIGRLVCEGRLRYGLDGIRFVP